MAYPLKLRDVSAAFIQTVLRKSGVLTDAISVTEIVLDEQSEGRGRMSAAGRVTIKYDAPTDAPATVFIKCAPEGSNFDIGNRLHTFEVEPMFYRTIMDAGDGFIPRTYFSEGDNKGMCIVMEDLEARPAFKSPTIVTVAETDAAMIAIANFHARFWHTYSTLEQIPDVRSGWKAEVQQSTNRLAATAWDSTRSKLEQIWSPYTMDAMARLIGKVEWLTESLRSLEPVCLTHSDYHPENIMVATDGRVVAFDWQVFGIGHPMHDVANFLCNVNVDDRRAHADRWVQMYLTQLGTHGIELPLENAMRAYRLFVLKTALMCVFYASFIEMGATAAKTVWRYTLQTGAMVEDSDCAALIPQ
eukprot:TRINITY_DN6677_c0_g1_i1.p1 TRINITY_DN6677_c0_g1~~TRINITY_DN6677_c0_g1_i1.p1  ORF type:complete len:358 (-),score=55.91 TRINITY_DN6677_c0_g1_i1:16-1089(-)